MSRPLTVAAIAVSLFLGGIGPVHGQVIYDANAAFVPNSPNPNGVWTYGYTSTLGGSFSNFVEYVTSSFGYTWRTNISSGTPGFNYFTSPGFGALAGETTLHGGPNGEFAIVRFTVSATALYQLTASWRGPGDSGNTDLYLLHNSNGASPLASTPSTTVTGNFIIPSIALNAGDTIDLALGTGGDGFSSDNTPVNLVITPIPEPGSLALLATSVGLTALARRFRRQRPAAGITASCHPFAARR